MKDENGIEMCGKNCFCHNKNCPSDCATCTRWKPKSAAYKARIRELQDCVFAKNECIKAYKSKVVEAERALEHGNAELEAAYEQLSNFVDNDKYPELYADFQTNAKALAESLKRVDELEKKLTTVAKLLEEKSFELGELQARVQLAERKEICVKENAEKLDAKLRAKRLMWSEIDVNNLWKAELGNVVFEIVKDQQKEEYVMFGGDNNLDLSSFDTFYEAMQAAQVWLDKFVEDCAEYDDKNQQKQVSTTTGTSESEVRNG